MPSLEAKNKTLNLNDWYLNASTFLGTDSDGEPVRRSLKRGGKGLKGHSKHAKILDVLETEAVEGSDEDDEEMAEDGFEYQKV